ncbi:MAG: cupin domain-containing protein [Alphaproteobacteria bacterium]
MTKKIAIAAADVAVRLGAGYPAPFDQPCLGKAKAKLGDEFGLNDFGVNLVTLPPATWSSQRHWHTQEDEFVYVLSGTPTLVTNDGETPLAPGMCAGFKAGEANGHHLVNRTDQPVVFLDIGSRKADDDAHYSDIDLDLPQRNAGGTFRRKDGTPYA